jgi:hypothetical protein
MPDSRDNPAQIPLPFEAERSAVVRGATVIPFAHRSTLGAICKAPSAEAVVVSEEKEIVRRVIARADKLGW